MAVAAAPLIAGTLSAAIIGGAGIGGVLGGVALAARDPRVKAAGSVLGKNMLATLEQQSKVFVGPVLTAIDDIGDSFDRVSKNTESIFRNSAKFVQPLTQGVTSALESIIGGVDKLVGAAGPVIDSLSKGIAGTGEEIGDLFSDISENADGAAASLDTVFGTINGLINVTGPLITGLTAINEQLARFGFDGGLLNSLDRLREKLFPTTEITRHVAGETRNLSTQMSTASAQATAYFGGLAAVNAELVEQAANSRNAYGATTAAAEALANATKTVNENGRGLSLNSEKGRENRRALEGVATALVAQNEASVRVNGTGVKSAAVADRNRAAFVALATKAGLSAGKARELAASLGLIPGKKTTAINASTSSASAKVSAFKKQLASVDTSRTVTFFVNVSESAKAAALRKNSASAFSAHSFAATDTVAGVSARTGGATPVNVSSEVSVSLDGRPFREISALAVRSDRKRSAFRSKVGPAWS